MRGLLAALLSALLFSWQAAPAIGATLALASLTEIPARQLNLTRRLPWALLAALIGCVVGGAGILQVQFTWATIVEGSPWDGYAVIEQLLFDDWMPAGTRTVLDRWEASVGWSLWSPQVSWGHFALGLGAACGVGPLTCRVRDPAARAGIGLLVALGALIASGIAGDWVLPSEEIPASVYISDELAQAGQTFLLAWAIPALFQLLEARLEPQRPADPGDEVVTG